MARTTEFQQTLVGKRKNGQLLGCFQESFFSFFKVDDVPDCRKVLKDEEESEHDSREGWSENEERWRKTYVWFYVLVLFYGKKKVSASTYEVSNDVSLPAGRKPINEKTVEPMTSINRNLERTCSQTSMPMIGIWAGTKESKCESINYCQKNPRTQHTQ